MALWWSQRYVLQQDITDTHHFTGHAVVQLRIIFRLLRSNAFLAYVQRFNISSPLMNNMTEPAVAMHILKCMVGSDNTHVRDVVPLCHIRLPAHVIPRFGKEANPCLTRHTLYQLLHNFWLNKYWNKEFYYALTLN